MNHFSSSLGSNISRKCIFFVIFNYTMYMHSWHKYFTFFNVEDEIEINIIGKMKLKTRKLLKMKYTKINSFLFLIRVSDCSFMHENRCIVRKNSIDKSAKKKKFKCIHLIYISNEVHFFLWCYFFLMCNVYTYSTESFNVTKILRQYCLV